MPTLDDMPSAVHALTVIRVAEQVVDIPVPIYDQSVDVVRQAGTAASD
jgi:hypothetical protein